jgi:hypothetical protein
MALRWPRRTRFREELEHPWYHDFAVLGVPTPQAEGIFGPNQQAKQGILFSLIDGAIRRSDADPTGLELFCADGFYSHYALQHGARHMTGVDLGDAQSAGSSMHLRQAEAMTVLLGHEGRADFRPQDVFDVQDKVDFVICAGGLYHVSDPAALLRRTRSMARSALVVQTVYSLAQTSPDYFETPAPGQTWGCRFSLDHLVRMLDESGWDVIDSTINELGGNARAEDRGSFYALCVPNRS